MSHNQNANDLDRLLKQQYQIAYPQCLVNIFEGDHLSAMILNSFLFWAKKTNNYFYKFIEPCNHPLYKKGDSWCEELMMSKNSVRYQFKKLKDYILVRKGCSNLNFYSVNYELIYEKLRQDEPNLNQNNFEHEESDEKIITSESEKVDLPVRKSELLSEKINTSEREKIDVPSGKNTLPTEKKSTSLLSVNHQSNTISLPEDEIKKMNVLKSVNILGNDGETICKKFSLDFIQKKIDLVKSKFDKGEIHSIRTYALSLFRNEPSEISPYEAEKIQEKKEKEAEKRKKIEQEKQNKIAEAEKQKAFMQRTDELLKTATENDLNLFVDELKDKSPVIYQKYLLYGIKSLLVESHYRQYLFQKYKC